MDANTQALLTDISSWANLAGLINSAGSGLVNSLFGTGGLFGHSQHYEAGKIMEYQNNYNKLMSQWNMENVTKPVFQMENEEWQRRFGQQNSEWERQWNMQNQYNSPTEQLKRWAEMGGNPATFVEGQTGLAPAAAGQVGSPTVNEAASQMAEPADYARMRSMLNEEKAKKSLAFYQWQQGIKQSIDNVTEADFRRGELTALGVTVKLGEAKTSMTKAEQMKLLADMYGWSAQGQMFLAQSQSLQQGIKESVEKCKLLVEQQRNAALQGDIQSEQLNWMPFEKYFGLEETRSRFIKNMQDAGTSYAQARLMYEQINTEVRKQALLGMQTDGQLWNNQLLYNSWVKDVEYTNKVYPKLIEFQGEQLTIDKDLYGKFQYQKYGKGKADTFNSWFDATMGNGLRVVEQGRRVLDSVVDAYAAFQTKGATKFAPTISTPGYNMDYSPAPEWGVSY